MAPEDMGGDVVLLGGGGVDEDDGGVVLVRYFRQGGGGVDQARGADGEEQVAMVDGSLGLLPGELGQAFAKPDDAGTDGTAALAAAWGRNGAAAVWFFRHAGGKGMGVVAFKAAGMVQAAVQVEYFGAAGPFVQVVHVLGDEGELGDLCSELGQGQMAGVGRVLQDFHAPPFVPAPDQGGIAAIGFRSGEFLGVEFFPETGEAVTKGGDAALGRNACSGKHCDPLRMTYFFCG